jgi:hypothetical protein
MIREAVGVLIAASLALPAGVASAPSENRLLLTLVGTVGDETGSPLPGASVRAYRAGRPAGAAPVAADGTYRLEFDVDPALDETIVVWWISPKTDLVSECAIVRESARDRALGLWGPCVPRIGAIREQSRDVRLLDAEAVRRRIAENGCAR